MVLKLYGIASSTCTARVIATLKEKAVPYELITVDFEKGEHKTAEYKEKQPFGQIPYIDDDGFILYESRAIARYVALKYKDQGTSLIPDPSNAKQYALFEQAASVESSNFNPYASNIVGEKIFKKFTGQQTDEKVVEEQTKTLGTKLDVYEVILSKHKYIAGDDFSLADIFHLSYGSFLIKAGVNHLENAERWPNVARWWKDITSRPSWKETQALNTLY